jgi:IS5 family transposase
MRAVQNPQLQFGQVDISKIQFDPKSRDDIPQILKGLQYIYINRSLREVIFALLEKHIAPDVSKHNGRPGMDLWKIFVLGVLRLDLNCDYDRVAELANHHVTVRLMLGHGKGWDDDEYRYHIQTIKDNLCLFTPELLIQINQAIVEAGHLLVKKKDLVLRGRCDSFVVETNVHYPTDINLLWDAMRKTIQLVSNLCERKGLNDWRQQAYNLRHIKRLLRSAQNKKRAKGRTEKQKEESESHVERAHRDYIRTCDRYLNKASNTLEKLEKQGADNILETLRIDQIRNFMAHATRQIDQIDRRVLKGEEIPHEEKCFSLFEPHTEWISKGKAGRPVELGLRVCVLEDQYQFILHHRVMEKETDEAVAMEMVREGRKHFPDLKIVSFDKGFHSKENQETLSKELDLLALPRKGKLSQQARALEESEEFRHARRKHSAVESAINALEVHGLDRCPDHGIDGFKRYVALAVVARNIQIIGALLQKRERKRLEKRSRNDRYDEMLKLAA